MGNDYLNLRDLLRALFDIISSSGRSYRISSKTTGRIFKTWSECFPQCLVVQVPKRIPVRRQTRPPSAIFDFSCNRAKWISAV